MVTSVASMIDQFNIPNIEILKKLGYEVHVACNFINGNTCDDKAIDKLKEKLCKLNVKYHQVDFNRSPFSTQTVVALNQIKALFKEYEYSVIHTQSPLASVITRLIARKYKGTKVIYTAHGFHFFKGGSKLSWLFYYPLEKLCSCFTDVLITINNEDYNLAKNKMKAKEVIYLPGIGIDTEKFSSVNIDILEKRKEFGFNADDIVLLSVGELNANKNHQVIIKALGRIKCDRVQYVIVGKGEEKDNLLRLSKENGLENRVKLLGFREDVNELLSMSDIFCFPSRREGLGLAAIEAMSSKLPIVTSNVGGIKDYSLNGVTGFSCNPLDDVDFAKKIKLLLDDLKLREKMGEYNQALAKKFDVKMVNEIMIDVYKEI